MAGRIERGRGAAGLIAILAFAVSLVIVALPTIRKNLAEMDEAINACESKMGSKIRIADHPVLGPLTVAQWRKFHMVHTRHHMKQIVALRDAHPAWGARKISHRLKRDR